MPLLSVQLCRLARRWTIGLALAAASLLVASPLFAQSTTGSIQGTTVDQSGAAVPGVTVTILNANTQVTRTLVTDAEGSFTAELLPVGPYEVTSEIQGFETKKTAVQLSVGQTVTLRVDLAVAAVRESVTVSATAPVLEVTRSQVSTTVGSTAIANLPVNGRNFIDFVLLTPGVTRDVRGGDISFAGQRGTLNSLVVDGADNTTRSSGRRWGALDPAARHISSARRPSKNFR
jgi:carboxypeptidase family protein